MEDHSYESLGSESFHEGLMGEHVWNRYVGSSGLDCDQRGDLLDLVPSLDGRRVLQLLSECVVMNLFSI